MKSKRGIKNEVQRQNSAGKASFGVRYRRRFRDLL